MPVVEFRHDRRQIIIPVAVLPPSSLTAGPLQMTRVRGLIDTGASLCGVRASVAAGLDLPRKGKTVITTPSGDHVARLHLFRLGFFLHEDATLPTVMARDFIGIASSPGEDFDVFIGMDLLGTGDLRVFRDGSGSFEFEPG